MICHRGLANLCEGILHHQTVASLAAAVSEAATEPGEQGRLEGLASLTPGLLPLRPSGGKRPFFCVHHGVGVALQYTDLARGMSDEQPWTEPETGPFWSAGRSTALGCLPLGSGESATAPQHRSRVDRHRNGQPIQ
jgi:hypothetical protein